MALADPVPPPDGLIRRETMWRHRPPLQQHEAADGLIAARWTGTNAAVLACSGAANADCHVVEVNLRPTDVAVTVDGNPVHDGRLSAGSMLLTPAGCAVDARYRSACDLLHLFVPLRRFEALAREGGISPDDVMFGRRSPDPAVTRLALSLMIADDLEGSGARLYAESVAVAILARVMGRSRPAIADVVSNGAGLVKWRHRRVVDFVEANLADPIRLPDLARVAGLSRMHFAAQFRAATGVRPHDYVVRRRIERAQELLRDSALPLAQIAMGVGFQTQAHFTTVFREHVHETPGRWRQLHRPE